MTLLGYGLGLAVPNLDQHIEWIILLVIFLSILPSFIAQGVAWWRSRAASARLVGRVRELSAAIATVAPEDDAAALRRLGDEVAAIGGEEIRTGIVHEHPPEVRVVGPQEAPHRLEVTVESSAPVAELSEAARQVAQWRLEASFARASGAIAEQLGAPQPLADGAAGSGYDPLRAAGWQLAGGTSRLLLLLHARHEERLRLSLVVERSGARP
jgi:hypothetical protein